MSVRIVTDSTCDLPAETIAKFGIQVVPLYINIGKQGYLDGVDISREQFYKNLPTYPVHPTTAAPSPLKFHVVYDALADEDATHVLSIHISAALSAIVDAARRLWITRFNASARSRGIGKNNYASNRATINGTSISSSASPPCRPRIFTSSFSSQK